MQIELCICSYNNCFSGFADKLYLCIIIIISKSCGGRQCGTLQKYYSKRCVEDREILERNVELQSSSGVKRVEGYYSKRCVEDREILERNVELQSSSGVKSSGGSRK